MNARRLATSTGLCFLGLIVLYFYIAHSDLGRSRASGDGADASESFPLRANCLRQIEAQLKMRGEVTVTEAMARHLGVDKKPDPAVFAQLRYMDGFFKSSDRELASYQVFPVGSPNVQITAQKKVDYGQNLPFDSVGNDGADYPQEFIRAGKVSAELPAISISYTARQRVVICGLGAPAAILIPLPRDPYLAFWMIAPAQRIDQRYQNLVARTTPCAANEIVEFNSSSSYWYSWDPRAHGVSAGGVPYDCRRLLKPGREIVEIESSIEKIDQANTPVDFTILHREAHWRAAIVFGLLKLQRPNSIEKIESLLRQSGPNFIEGEKLLTKEQYTKHADVDPVAWAVLHFILSLRSIADVESVSLHPNLSDSSLRLDVEATLKKSRKKITIESFIGSTDVFGKTARHWDFLKRNWENSDFIFYVGHSGLGRNMMLPAHVFASGNSAKKYQMLGIISCYSNFFFGVDYLANRNQSGLTSDLLLVASTRYLHLVPLQIFSYFDERESGSNASLSQSLSSLLKRDEMIMIDRQVTP